MPDFEQYDKCDCGEKFIRYKYSPYTGGMAECPTEGWVWAVDVEETEQGELHIMWRLGCMF